MKATAIVDFYDKKERTLHKAGEVFSATADRIREINSTKYGKLCETVGKPEKAEETSTPETVEDKPEVAETPEE